MFWGHFVFKCKISIGYSVIRSQTNSKINTRFIAAIRGCWSDFNLFTSQIPSMRGRNLNQTETNIDLINLVATSDPFVYSHSVRCPIPFQFSLYLVAAFSSLPKSILLFSSPLSRACWSPGKGSRTLVQKESRAIKVTSGWNGVEY